MTKKRENIIPTGVLLIIGGKENKGGDKVKDKETPSDFKRLEILKTLVELTKKEDPVIEVVTSASGEGEASFQDYKEAFGELGITKLGRIHHNERREVLQDDAETRIVQADAVFLAGGDQLKYTSLYGGTPFLVHLKERYVYGHLVIGGTSAGAMAMSTPMIYAGNDEVQEIGGEVKITTGLEFLRDVCVDTHFINRGRFVRMAQVIMTNPTCVGIGIGEDTALIVRNGVECKVLGSGLIIVMEGFEIKDANIDDFLNKKPISVRDLKVHILSDGNTYCIPQNNPPHV
ncbi:MAG TPA: cyanophycinase [Flavisolibacter sp.]|nr:cyanophycinase [Flavisolibacter sp.]